MEGTNLLDVQRCYLLEYLDENDSLHFNWAHVR